MRHNARVTILSDNEPPLNIFLASRATPHEIKVISRNALRGMRRHLDYEQFYIKFIRLTKVELTITSSASSYLWEYEFHLSPLPPRVTIINRSNGLCKTLGLFRWIGPELAKIVPVNIMRSPDYGKKRGRPSALSKLSPQSKPPLYISPDHKVYFTIADMRADGIDPARFGIK